MEVLMAHDKGFNRRGFIKTSVAGMVGSGLLAQSELLRGQDKRQEDNIKIREYRTLGRTGFKVSDIGVGASFLTNKAVLEMALDMGLNYLDTGEHYSRGQSERTIGEVLKNRKRDSVFITTKLNLRFFGKPTKKNLKERFMKCLERLQTDYVDCLMIHMCLQSEIGHEAFHAAAKELKAEKRVNFIGLSNHGIEQSIYGRTSEPMEQVVTAAVKDGRFDVALFVYNFLQKEQGEKIIDACAQKGVGVTLMKTNPVNVYKRWKQGIENYRKRSGKALPERIKRLDSDYKTWLEKAETFKKKYGLRGEEEIRDAAIKFVLANPGVHTVCPSMNSFEGLQSFAALSGGKLVAKEVSMLNNYQHKLGSYYCRHACGECEPSCPHQVPVNTIMRFNHYFEAQGQEKHAMAEYAKLQHKADYCSQCSGQCQQSCPHGVPVQSLLINAHQNLILG
jgi:predicted aldo/keto reductase-like oxidoreductase